MLMLRIASFLSLITHLYYLLIWGYLIIRLLPNLQNTRILSFLKKCTEPYLRIFRFLPLTFANIDFSPIVALFAWKLITRLIIDLLLGVSTLCLYI